MESLTMTKSELIHYRLQAMLRENSFSDLSYLGIRDDVHWYNIGGNEDFSENWKSITKKLESVEE